MAHRKIEEELERMSLLREAARNEAMAALGKALKDRVNLIVAKAAKMAAELELRELTPALVQAFERLFEDAVRADPQCWGKNAIAAALRDLGHGEYSPFLRGAKHVQIEPAYMKPVDTAVSLRGLCLLALLPCGDLRRGDLLRVLVDALTDDASPVRVEAARALEQMEGEEGALLLRLKARLGDEEAAVVGQVFDSLLRLERDRGLPFVGEFLKGTAVVREEAALALGTSRLAGGVELLEGAWNAARDPEFRQVILRAMSVSRQERGLQFLLGIVSDGREADVKAALGALSLDRESEEIRRQAEAAATQSGAAALRLFHQFFN